HSVRVAPAARLSEWSKRFLGETPGPTPRSPLPLTPLEDSLRARLFDRSEEFNLVFRVQLDDGLLTIRQPADAEAIAALLADVLLGAHRFDAHAEQLLHRFLDLRFVGMPADLEGVGIVVRVRALVRALLGDHRPQDDLVRAQLRPDWREDLFLLPSA